MDYHCTFIDVHPSEVLIAAFPDGPIPEGDIWAQHFLGIKVRDNPDGTIRVQIYGPAPNDFTQAVFRK